MNAWNAWLVLMLIVLVAGCEDNTSLADEAYSEGHLAGRVSCNGVRMRVPDYTGELRTSYNYGYLVGQRAAGCGFNPYHSEELPNE